MCRLLGYVADRPTSVREVLGEEGLRDFTALTAVHGDGWGMAWRDDDGRVRTTTSSRSAVLDEEYDDLVARPLGTAGFVHLRWATGGLAVSPENTHPFVEGDRAFGHNGHISPIDRLEELLDDDSLDRLRGTTDSERYFRFVEQCIDREGDETGGVTRAVGELRKEFPHASLNALLLTADALFSIHVNSCAEPPVRALREMFETPEAIPTRHETDYFAMDYRVVGGAVHVISSGLDPEGWTPVPEDTAVRVDLTTREMTRLDP